MTGRLRATINATALMAVIAPLPLQAASQKPYEAEVAKCIRQSAQGRKWLEMTLWGLRDQEGGWAGAVVPNTNGTTDLGPLQINSWWVPKFASMTGGTPEQVRRWLIADICFNIDAGRWIFLTELGATRNYWSAIGAYHSPTPLRRQRYATQVAKKLVRRFGAGIFHSSAPPPSGANMETSK